MKRLLQLGLLFLLGVTAGFLGMYWANRHIHNKAELRMGMDMEVPTVEYYARAEYKYADRESARQALLYNIQTLNQLKKAGATWGISQLVDLGNSYGELSLLEESTGNSDLAHKYMAQAVQALKDAGMKEPSASEASLRKRLSKEPFVNAGSDGRSR